MNFDLHALAVPPEAALHVLDRLHVAGFEAFFVGGCVRDRLIGRAVGDWDLTTDARPEQVLELFDHVVPTGLQHGTVTVVHGGLNIEVTTYRVDLGYEDGRRPLGVAFTRELTEDLARRDFTMNAMAWDPRRGLFVDLYGGRADLGAGLVRAVGDPESRFREDGLRALRAVRFAAVLGLEIETETWAAIGRTLEVFRKVSVERIQVELVKTLLSRRAGWGVLRLGESGLLGEFLPHLPLACLPEVAAALDRAAPALPLRVALLLSPLVGAFEAPLEVLRFSNQVKVAVAGILRTWGLRPDQAHDEAGVRALVSRIGRAHLDAALAFHEALETPTWAGLGARIDAAGARDCPLTPRELALSGDVVMTRLGLPPSREVGRLLEALLARVWAEPALNTPEGLAKILPDVHAALRSGEG